MERDTLYTLVALGLIMCLAMTAGCVGRGKRAGKQPPAKSPPGPATTDTPAVTAAPSEPTEPVEAAAPVTEADLDVEDIEDIDVPDLSDDDLEVPDIPEDELTIEEPDFAEESELDIGGIVHGLLGTG